MSLLDLILPTPQKTQEQLNQLISQNILNVMSSSKFSSGSATTQTVNINVLNGASLKNATFEQVAAIDTSVFLNDSTNIQLQSDLANSLKNTLMNEATSMPFGREPNINTKISNVVDNSIKQNFTHEKMTQLNNAVSQAITINVIGQGSNASNISAAQKADVISKFADSVASSISGQLVAKNTADNTSSMKVTNWLSETIGALSSFIGGLMSGPVYAIIVFFALIILAVIVMRMATSSGSGTKVVYAAATPAPAGGIDTLSLPSVGRVT
jgi:hypothetical protein